MMVKLKAPSIATLRLIWLGLAALGLLLGLLLRWQLWQPLGLVFKHWLHAHSHVMLLGWLWTGLTAGLFYRWGCLAKPRLRWLYLGHLLSVTGMMVSFPFQGYAAVSISFATLHVFISYALVATLWRLSRGRPEGGWVRLGVVFHLLSTMGLFAIGPLAAQDMQASPWYAQAILFYLHFQYGGAFLSWLWAGLSARRQLSAPSGGLLLLAVLGILGSWTQNLRYSWDHPAITGVAAMGGFLLLATLAFQWRWPRYAASGFRYLVAAQWLLFALPLVSLLPGLHAWASASRAAQIAFLHFLFLGIYTPYLLQPLWRGRGAVLYLILFLSTELCLILPSVVPPAWALLMPGNTFGAYAALVALLWYLLWQRRRPPGSVF